MKALTKILIRSLLILYVFPVLAQDPKLPSANFGLTNFQAGTSKTPGWYYVQYLQVYNNSSTRDASGNTIFGAQTTSITALQQLVWVTNIKLFDGNFGVNTLLPLVTTSATNSKPVNINPSPVGDVLVGPFVEWHNQGLNKIKIYYRLGVNLDIPTGSYNSRYDVNAGAHRYRYFPHFELTVVPSDWLAVSVKNNLYIYFRELDARDKTGTTYDLNYALEFNILKRLTLEAAGYYLIQLQQDSYAGDSNYYNNRYGVVNTKEKVFAAGPGLVYTTSSKLTLELKAMWEAAAVNRTQGFRSTLVLSLPLK